MEEIIENCGQSSSKCIDIERKQNKKNVANRFMVLIFME